MSVDEKIRRAEEIYNRRNSNNYYSTHISSTKKFSFKRRLFKQIIICMCVYCVFYVTSNREYFLSEEFRKNAEEFSKKNELLNNTYNYVMGYIDKYLNRNSPENSAENSESNDVQSENNSNIEESPNNTTSNINEENIGGAIEEIEPIVQKSQEELDAEYIKNKLSFIVPVEGRISSTFGWRNPTNPNVPRNHTGLDLAAPTGTVIKSATDGVVTMVSSAGDYGKHYRIQNDDITIVYAHCSKLYLKEGDSVVQGQEIGEVGSTGNSTRSTFTL